MFEVELKLSDASKIKSVINEIRRILDLDAEPRVIQQSLVNTGVPESDIVPGIRIPGVWSVFEAGCRAILGQQISVKAAINLITKLTQQLGTSGEEGMYFPEPDVVADSELEFLGMPQSRRDTLREFARAYSQASNSEDLDEWLQVKGVGPWTVAYARMRGQSHPDIWLNTDLVIKKQINQYQLKPEQASPWRSYLTFQLWSMA